MKKKFITVACLMVVSSMISDIFGASKSLPIVEIMGNQYYMYVAKKGDSLFGIAREQNWDDNELQRLNGDAVSRLKKGVKLYYPVEVNGSFSSPAVNTKEGVIKTLTHVVAKGESIYSIAEKYNISVDKIYSLNPGSRNGIKIGQSLKLRESSRDLVTPGVSPGPRDSFYTFSEKESISDVANKYNTSVGAILGANPGIRIGDIKPGTKIKIPADGSGLAKVSKIVETPVIENFDTYTVEGKDNWESIAEKTGLSASILEQANPDVKKLKKKQVIALPKISSVKEEKEVIERDVREETSEGVQSIYKDIHRIGERGEITKMKVVILAENPSSKKDTEFIRGFLTGVNQLKDSRYQIDLNVIDGSKSNQDVIAKLNATYPTIVFYTGDKNIPDYLLEYAESSLTPVVNTFDIKNEDYLYNPYVIQLLTPSSYFNETVASNAYNRFGDHKLIIIGEEDESDQLAPELKKLWNPKRITYLPVGIVDSESYADSDKYLFYTYDVKKPEVEKVLKDIAAVKEISPFASISVLGRPNWIVYDTSLGEEMSRVNTYVPSRFYLDESSNRAKKFNSDYKNLFNREPAKSLPLYAGVGYDVATYFLPSLGETHNDINSLKASRNTLQSEINLKRINNWSGLVNPPVYFVNFTPYNSIDKIVIE